MQIKRTTLKNFRGYKEEVDIEFQNLTVFIGKNDVGKSTVLEALDIFFNDGKGVVNLDVNDINKVALQEGDSEITISVEFENLPSEIVIDATNKTSLSDEYLLNSDGNLTIIKKYPNASASKAKVYIKAMHPNNKKCNDLLSKRNNDLRKIIEQENIECSDRTVNATMRAAIWKHFEENLEITETEIDVTKEDAKNIWVNLQKYMPIYSLFQSDRSNNDNDKEVQNPLERAVQEIFRRIDIQEKLDIVASEVEEKLEEVSNRTLEKLREMNPEIADSLNPVIPNTENLKWAAVFKNVSITGDNDIPINKRGSGIRRLILINFFRAEAERRIREMNAPSIIYAIEEPETSQHAEHQKKLIEAFLELADAPNTQIVLTTHCANIVKKLQYTHLRLIGPDRKITNITKSLLPYPSLNEVNFVAFGEISVEYHDELYGYILEQKKINQYKVGKETRPYIKLLRDGSTSQESRILSAYIRDLIHHPENTHNARFSDEELSRSICEMREFIKSN